MRWLFVLILCSIHSSLAQELVALQIEPLGSISGTAKWDWWQARSTMVPGKHPFWISTMSETGKSTSHDFHDIYQSISHDEGRTWSEPKIIPTLTRTKLSNNYEVAAGDLWPGFHSKSGKVLATGKTFNFADGKREEREREKISYAVMDPKSGNWGKLLTMAMPKKDHHSEPIIAPNAGCTQRVDLPNGDILLPVRYWRNPEKGNYVSTVVRCKFDGETLTYIEHGSELTIPKGRGFYEPSLVEFRERYFLTLRADDSAYVAKSRDGLRFDSVQEWTFDDGSPLGSYNTQQHWVAVGGGLFLVYTRKGAENDHIMRHRAPLFIGQVNPDALKVIRASERILIPENHATLGNSGVCRIDEDEYLITCGEGLLRLGKRKTENNKVIFVKVLSQSSAP